MGNRGELGVYNARQQVKLVKQLRDARKRQGLTSGDVAKSMQRDGLVVATGPDFVRNFEAGGMNFSMALLRSYAKAVGATLELKAIFPEET